MSARLTAVTVAAALALVTSACSPSSSSGGDAEGPSSDEAAAAAEPASGTIRYESWTPTPETFDALVAGFAESDPDVEVESTLSPVEDYKTSLQAQLRSGDGPDVFVLEPGAMFNQFRQYVEPIDDYAEASLGDGWQDDYKAEAIGRAQVDDTSYGLPLGYGVAGFLWVNRTVLDQAGLEVPTSYDDLVAAARTLKSEGIAPIALGAQDTWQRNDYFLALAAAADPEALYAAMEGEGSWTEPALVEAFAHWQQLFEDGVVQDGALGAATYNDTYDLFANGKAAFFANGSWNLDMFVNSLDAVGRYDIDAAPLPVPGGDTTAPITGDVTGIVVVNKDSDNKVAAYRFAEYLSHGGGGQVWADAFLDFPVTEEAVTPQELPEQAQAARTSIEGLIADDLAGYRQVPSPAVAEALAEALGSLASGSLDAEEAADEVQQAADDA